jgi:hypothetical protein
MIFSGDYGVVRLAGDRKEFVDGEGCYTGLGEVEFAARLEAIHPDFDAKFADLHRAALLSPESFYVCV